VKLLSEKIKLLEEGFKKAYMRDGAVCGVLEIKTQPKSEVDGAMLEAFNLGIVNEPAVFEKTLQKIEKLRTASGGYRRNLGPSDYEAHEFLLIDFNLIRAFMKFGKKSEAARLLETIVDKSVQDNGLIAEMYVSEKNRGSFGEIGDPAGSIPMAGFGSGAYGIVLSEREKAK
jgi:GH15 family glucan-1,4-alpha-glucosidase